MYSLLFAQEECKLMNLVSVGTDNTPTTTTLIISEGTNVQHASVIKLVRQNVSALEEFGRVRFEIRPFETAGGTQTREIAILNEQQATLLFTFMKNTKIVKAFKIALVKAFYEMALKLRQQQTTPAFQIPQSLPEALRLAANLAEQKMQLEAKVKEDARSASRRARRNHLHEIRQANRHSAQAPDRLASRQPLHLRRLQHALPKPHRAGLARPSQPRREDALRRNARLRTVRARHPKGSGHDLPTPPR